MAKAIKIEAKKVIKGNKKPTPMEAWVVRQGASRQSNNGHRRRRLKLPMRLTVAVLLPMHGVDCYRYQENRILWAKG